MSVATETMAERLETFLVRFFHPQTKLLHSSHTVKAPNAVEAVRRAVDWALANLNGTEVQELPTYTASVTDQWGRPVQGIEKQLTRSQIVAQMAQLQAAIDALGPDGQTPQQIAAAQQIPGVNQYVNAPPPVSPPSTVNPAIYQPQNNPPQSVVVDPSAAPAINAGQFTQADVDAQIADALAKAGVSQ